MIDIKLIRTNPELVKENIRKKFQDEKLPLVDEVFNLDKEYREAKTRCDFLRGRRNAISKQIGGLWQRATRKPPPKQSRKWRTWQRNCRIWKAVK